MQKSFIDFAMRQAKVFLRNTLILTGASLLLRILAMGFQVLLSRWIGAAGIGLYELLMSAYGLAAAVAVSGVRLSTTRLVLELPLQKGYARGSVMLLCLGYSLVLGISAAALLWLGSDLAASAWLDAPELGRCLRLLAFSLPCMAVSACLGGCFTALRHGGRITTIQVTEFLFHAGMTALLFFRQMPHTSEEACLLLCKSALCSELFSAVLGSLFFRLERLERRGGIPFSAAPDLLSIAAPDAVGSWIRSGLVTAKHMLIPKGLRKTGIGAQEALAAYGVIQGMTLPILTFPSILLGTVSGLLIPEIAERNTKGELARLRSILRQVLHLTLLFSFFAAAALMVWGGTLGQRLYRSAAAGRYIRMLAPLTPLMYLDTAVDGMLKGLGLQTASMRINILDAALSLLLVWQLIPRRGVGGYLIILYFSETLNFLLSYRRLFRHAGLKIELYRSVLAPVLAVCAAVLTPFLLAPALAGAHPLLSFFAAGTGYFLLLRLFGAISGRELRYFRMLFQKEQ